ncbi:UNVERIFIED_CONTAM: Formin-like protein 5 [Sesamum radiatum]|uniref:Formin-like protein n=1 Tax=Sesamum radiatum TaxID=300843 RepID=A0AAW2T3F1_SESRA
MRIQEKGGVLCCLAFVFLIFLALATGVESKREGHEPLLAYLLESGVINQEMAELLRVNCMPELLNAKKRLQDVELHFMEERARDSSKLLNGWTSSTKIHDTVTVLLPQVNQILIDCVKGKNHYPPMNTGEEKGLDSWYTRYFRFLFNRHSSSTRRMLAQASGEAPAPSPTVLSPTPAPSLPPAPTEVPASPPLPPFFPRDLDPSNLQPTSSGNASASASDVQSRNQKTSKKTVVIAVSVTASVTFVIAALLFLFCRRCCGTGSGRGRNDESPLLSLSLSDYSIGTTAIAATNSGNSLQMPPGMLGAPGLPPLKPPPGRMDPPKPPLGNATSPPPPPAAPVPPSPPSIKPSSGVPRPLPRGPPPPPPIPSGIKGGPRPPPPPAEESEAGTTKTKLKPFFWDKVLANPDQSMVWHQIKSGSFQFNEEMIETLFGYAPAEKNKSEAKKESTSQDVPPQYIQIIDPKKSQNLSILLKALNVTTEEVCDALQEGNELPSELIQTLLKMAPTAEEELKLRLYSGPVSQLGPAERFLKVLVDIPFAFKRLESLLFMCTLQEEMLTLKESFAVLEAACTELRKSRLFLKLLEAVLKTGNRMNDGTFRGGAQAFKLDTLLKLSDVKGTDGKTTLLHFVVQEIIRVSGLSNELENVKRAAILDTDSLTGTVAKLGHALVKARNFLNSDMKNIPEENGFHQTLRSFVQNVEVDVRWSLEEEKRIMALVKSTADYFHGNSGKDEGLRLFVIVRDFLIILDKVCKEVKNAPRKPSRTSRSEDTAVAPPDPRKTVPSSTAAVPSNH